VVLGERIGDEALGGQARTAQITACQAGAGHVQFASHADRQALAVGGQHIGAQIGQRHADRAVAGALCILCSQRMGGDMHRGFGDAVHVQQGGALAMLGEPRRQGGRLQRFAAEDHQAQVVLQVAVSLCIEQRLEGAGCLVEHAHALLAEQGMERGRIARDVLRHHEQASAVGQRAPQFPDREVEGAGVEQGPDILGGGCDAGAGGVQQAHDLSMGNDHALGRASGAGGVDDVGRMLRQQVGALRCVRRLLRPGVGLGIHPHGGDAGVGGQRGSQFAMGEQQARLRIVEHEGQPLRGVGRVHRQIGGA